MQKNSIRPFSSQDTEAIQNICYATGFMGMPADKFWKHKQSFVEIWTTYYINHEAPSLLVATQDNQVVGYLTGCINTFDAPSPAAIAQEKIKEHWLAFRPGTAGFIYRSIRDSLTQKKLPAGELRDKRWPSHLHINLLPPARGTGLGKALIEKWLEKATQSGSMGCHLGTLVENKSAVHFFEKMGFTKLGEPTLVPGMRGIHGERLHEQIMVINL